MESEMLMWLESYFQNTPKSQIQEDWKSIKDLKFQGPNAFEYLDFLNQTYCYEPPQGYILNPSKISNCQTPNFSESFF